MIRGLGFRACWGGEGNLGAVIVAIGLYRVL